MRDGGALTGRLTGEGAAAGLSPLISWADVSR